MKSTDPDLHDLAERIEKVEASNRRWKLASILLALSAICVLLIAAKPANRTKPSILRATTVEVRDIILKDDEGNVCARLSVLPKINRLNDHTSVVIQSDNKDRAVLEIYDEKGLPVWTAPPSTRLVRAK